MHKDSFMFFRNMRDIIKTVPRELQLELREAIEDYVFDGIEPTDWAFKAIIQSIKPSLEYVGRGAPKGNQNAKKEAENLSSNTSDDEVNNDNFCLSENNSKQKNQKNQLSEFNSNETKKQEAEAKAEAEDIYPPDMLNNISSPVDRKKEFQQQFEEFWKLYVPVSSTSGKMVAKGSKSEAEKKFIRILENGENYENIRNGLQKYLDFCRRNDQITCGVAVFLNQKRWLDGYDNISVSAENAGGKRQEPVSLLNTYAELADQYRNGEPVF